MSAPTRKTPAKRASARASTKRAPAATAADSTPELTDEELAALAEEPAEPQAGEIRPVVIGKRGRRGDAPVEMVTIFEIDDVPYQIPRNPSAAFVLSWMRDVQQSGVPTANANIAFKLLGAAPFTALENAQETEPEDLYEIFSNIGAVFFTSENYRKIMEAPDPS